MTHQQAFVLLQASSAFAHTNRKDLEKLATIMQIKHFGPEQFIHHEGNKREYFSIVIEGQVNVVREAVQQGNSVIVTYNPGDTISEGLLVEDSFHTTSAIAATEVKLCVIDAAAIHYFMDEHPTFKAQVYENLLKQLVNKLNPAKASAKVDILKLTSGKTRTEHDLLGDKEVPDYAYFGIQTMRAQENFHITGVPLHRYPELIYAFAYVKKAAAMAAEIYNLKKNALYKWGLEHLDN